MPTEDGGITLRIATCRLDPQLNNLISIEEQEANAKLIAAAPLMIEALLLATQELNAIRARDGAPQHIDWHRGQPMQTDSCTHEWWNELTEKCLDAIEKATGSRDILQ